MRKKETPSREGRCCGRHSRSGGLLGRRRWRQRGNCGRRRWRENWGGRRRGGQQHRSRGRGRYVNWRRGRCRHHVNCRRLGGNDVRGGDRHNNRAGAIIISKVGIWAVVNNRTAADSDIHPRAGLRFGDANQGQHWHQRKEQLSTDHF
jgi:hypothetical protein